MSLDHAGFERELAAIPADQVVIVGLDLQHRPSLNILLDHFPNARVISFSNVPASSRMTVVAKRPRAIIAALLGIRARALIVAHDQPKLEMLTLLVPAELHLRLRGNQLQRFDVGTLLRARAGELRHELREAQNVVLETALGRSLPGPIGPANDYSFIDAPAVDPPHWASLRISVIVPVYDRRAILEKTLAALALQTYPKQLFEVIVADDGSSDHPESLRAKIDVRFVRQEHDGFRLAAVRNLGIRAATGEVIILLDCDVLPEPQLIAAHARWFHASSASLVVIGALRYVNTDRLSAELIADNFERVRALPDIPPPWAPGDAVKDWRRSQIAKTSGLKTHDTPYLLASGGNVSFRRRDALEAGLFDESFRRWGGEDGEFAFRLYRRGAYFIPEAKALGHHQDHPPAAVREEDRKLSNQMLGAKVPSCRHYALGDEYEAPAVSIYIPAFNSARFLARAIESVRAQTFPDFEVCIVDDGSSDDTEQVLRDYAARDRRIRWMRQEHRGIAAASQRAVDMARGEFILQLDADDELLPDAVKILLETIRSDSAISLVYGGLERIDAEGRTSSSRIPPRYSAFAHLHGQVVSAPRMFRARDYHRTAGFDPSLENAVDYDICLKLAERGRVVAVPRVLYRYHLHGGNTSIARADLQISNHRRVIRAALERRGLEWELEVPDPRQPRRIYLVPKRHSPGGNQMPEEGRVRSLVARIFRHLGRRS